jgi:tetratricopeptide (TPR) repeat protein
MRPYPNTPDASLPVGYTEKTSSWSQATNDKSTSHTTGTNTTQDRIASLLKAKEKVEVQRAFMDSPQVKLTNNQHEFQVTPEKSHDRSSGGGNVVDDFGNDDGLAPLGGVWPHSDQHQHDQGVLEPEMLDQPELFLHNIHDNGVRYLKRGRFAEALHLLEVVLDCQRQLHGTVHEDVAGALHNVGIANLRLEDHYKALQAFEEAVRVRKGALGRDHPLVAVSSRVM